MSSQEQNDQADKEECVVKLLTAGIEGYFFKWETAIRQNMLQDKNLMMLMAMQGNQKNADHAALQGKKETGDAEEIKKTLINIFTKLASENLSLKLENAILQNRGANDTKKSTPNQ